MAEQDRLINFSSHQDKYLKSNFQACDGAERCIVSCHEANHVWDGYKYHKAGKDHISRLSRITKLTLTDQNIEKEVDVGLSVSCAHLQ